MMSEQQQRQVVQHPGVGGSEVWRAAAVCKQQQGMGSTKLFVDLLKHGCSFFGRLLLELKHLTNVRVIACYAGVSCV